MANLIYTTNPMWLLLIATLIGAQIGAALSIISMTGGKLGRSAREKREAEFLKEQAKHAAKALPKGRFQA